MKPNVDLTDSRIFTTFEEPTGIVKLLLDSLKVKKPWDFENNPKKFKDITSDAEVSDFSSRRSLIPVGNKKERQIWKLHRAYDADEICDCCGQSRGKKPWAKNKCNCYSMTFTPKIPWRF